MGILNVTPDSFSDGGEYDTKAAAHARAAQMIAEGAAIIDIGGESTRPGAEVVSECEELERTIPVVQSLSDEYPAVCLSIDTSKAAVAEAAVAAGASVINDVTGFSDPDMVAVAAQTGAGLVCMHMQGTPQTMQLAPEYSDVVAEVEAFFSAQLDRLLTAGISADAIAFDPGIGFGKRLEDNLVLIRELQRLSAVGRPLLLGVSRKSFIGKVLDSESMEDRSWPTVAITALAAESGVALHRVHEVRENLHALRMAEAVQAVR